MTTDAAIGTIHAPTERERSAVERIVFFTDAVIAIVITLMVIEVKPPHVAEESQLVPTLLGLWHEYLAVIVSFLVIGLCWARHHTLFQWVVRHDAVLTAINLFFLIAISAIPFVTAVLAQHGGSVGTILYAATVALVSVLIGLLWTYAGERDGIAPELPRSVKIIGISGAFATAAIFLASIPIAFWDADVAKFFWLGVLLVSILRRLLLQRYDKAGAA